jgi:hypothetical protein
MADDRDPDADDLPWWQHRPGMGIVLAAALGIATLWISLSLLAAPQADDARFLRFVTLPFLLFVPAASVFGVFLAARALSAARGFSRVLLAAPAALALVANLLALAQFARLLSALIVR